MVINRQAGRGGRSRPVLILRILLHAIAAWLAPIAGLHAAAWVEMRPADAARDRSIVEPALREDREGGGGLRVQHLYVGRADIDGDGIAEAFVVFDHPDYCGSAGCRNIVYRRHEESWAPIAGLDGGVFIADRRRSHWTVAALGETIAGRRTLLGAEIAAQWSEDAGRGEPGYRHLCVTDRCGWNEAFPPVFRSLRHPLQDRVVPTLGRYQFGKTVQVLLGLRNRDGDWLATNRYRVKSQKAFLATPVAQEKALADLVTSIEQRLEALGATSAADRLLDTDAGAIRLSLSGMVAAAHRWGPRNVADYVRFAERRGGRVRSSDIPPHLAVLFRGVENRLAKFQAVPHRR